MDIRLVFPLWPYAAHKGRRSFYLRSPAACFHRRAQRRHDLPCRRGLNSKKKKKKNGRIWPESCTLPAHIWCKRERRGASHTQAPAGAAQATQKTRAKTGASLRHTARAYPCNLCGTGASRREPYPQSYGVAGTDRENVQRFNGSLNAACGSPLSTWIRIYEAVRITPIIHLPIQGSTRVQVESSKE